VRASVAAEKAGVPTVTIVATGFLSQARAVAKALGMENLAIAEYPGVIMNQSKEELRKNVETVLVRNIVRELTKPVENAVQSQEPGPEDIIVEGTLDEVSEFFLQKQWSDGLPVIPPTPERIQAFLRFTDRKPEEVIGILAPEYREATIWNTAVNGVMAGCRPEYMPVLIAIVEAIAEPDFHLRDAGATPGWEPLIILNGPVVKELDFNYECGVLRAGRQANTSIGRFLRLYMRNVAGLRIAPGSTDKGSIGIGLNVVLAENEDALDELGWESFSGQRGFRRDDNVVTVQSALSPTIPIYSAGDRALDHMDTFVEIFGGTCAFWSHTAVRKGKYFPLLVISPGVAKVIARDGWKKEDIQRHLFAHTKVSVRALQKHAWQIGFSVFDIHALVEQGIVSPDYIQSDNPDRLVPAFIRPEWIGLVVSGDPGRNQSKGFVQNHDQAPPISKRIVLPANWKKLLGTDRNGLRPST
jgi:hypothetical protein